MNRQRIRVFHYDDSVAFRELVRFWLDEHPDLEHVGAAHDLPAALAGIAATRPDVVLLDRVLRPREDRSVVQDVRRAAPGARVVVYSGYPRDLLEREFGSAPDAFLAKGEDDAALVATLRALAPA